jgi:zinc protease
MPLPPLPAGPTRHVLDNGLTVILQENHTVPVVAFNVCIRAGSAEETDAESGIAHVHEHMLFKGTKRRGVGEIAQAVESSGGHINAFTSFDQTVYYDVIASRYLETGLDVLADAVQNSSFDPSELAKEKEVVLEEIKRGEDMPGSKLSKALFGMTYRVHPYRRPIIGTEKHVRSFTREMILDFYRRWYVSNNIVLVGVGDFETPELVSKIARAFDGFEPRSSLQHKREIEPTQRGIRLAIVPEETKQGYLMLGFPTCGIRHPDTAALDVLSIVLGQGESSRLYRRVKSDQEKVHEVRAHSYTLKDPGLFLVSGLLDPALAMKAQEAILREIFRLRGSLVSHRELEKAQINLEADAIYDRETVQGQAVKLGYFETVAGDIAYEEKYLRRVSAVTPEDVRRVARKYFRGDRLNLALLLPKRAAAAMDEETIRAAAGAAERAAARSRPASTRVKARARGEAARLAELASHRGAPGDHPIHRALLPNGITLLVKESHAVPVVAMRSVMLGGLVFENRKANGISDFVSNMLTKGTRKRSAKRLAEEIEQIAGSIESHSGRNSFGVEIEVLSRYLDRGIDIMADVLMEPAFDPKEIEKQRNDSLAAIKRREDNLAGFAVDTFTETLYERHPYRYTLLGTPRSVKAFKRKDLRDYYTRIASPENIVIAVVGDVRTQEIVPKFGRALRAFPPRPFKRPRTRREPVPGARRYKEVHKDKAQAHLMYGFLGTTVMDPDKYALDVMSTVLAGQGGRLFLELRDRQSLAYTVTSFTFEGIDPGYVGVYMGTSPEKVRRALAGVRRELAKIRRELVPEEELERAQRNLVGGYEIDLQRVGAQATQLAFSERYGLGIEEYHAYPEKILAVTAEDVRRVARKYLRLEQPVIALVRPPQRRQRRQR